MERGEAASAEREAAAACNESSRDRSSWAKVSLAGEGDADVVRLAEAIANVGEEGWRAGSDAELPFDRVRRDAGRVDRPVVDAVKVMRGADDRAVVTPVVAAAGAKADVVIMEIAA